MTKEWIVTLDYTSRRARVHRGDCSRARDPTGTWGRFRSRQNAYEYLESLSYRDKGGCCRCQK